MSNGIVLPISAFAAATTGTLALGLISRWIDRKVTARLQWRVGPPWYQPLADVIKLLGKETLLPDTARGTGFLLMPVVAFAAVSLAATILWWVTFSPTSGFVGDLIVVWYLLTVPGLTAVLGGSMSGNPLAAVGAAREMKLILAYELPLLLAVLAAIMGATADVAAGGTTFAGFRLGALKLAETQGVWATIGCVVAFIVALMATQAKLGLTPFDIAEAECEIAGGPFIEYSGAPLALIHMTRAMLMAVMPLFLITIFWGGFSFASIGLAVGSILKYVLVIVVFVLVRNTNPRIRIDHALRFFWFGMTPLALIALVLSMLYTL